MATTTSISGNTQKNNGATIYRAGNIDTTGPVTNDFTVSENLGGVRSYGATVLEAGGYPAQSGNLGTFRPLSAGRFGEMETGQYVAKILGTRIAQTDDTFLRSGAAQTSSRRSLHYARGNRRYNITDWSVVSGVPTYGGSQGALVTYVDPADGTAQAMEPFPTNAVPGELVFLVTGLTPSQNNYSAKTT